MDSKGTLLVFRFSAMGDVAMSASVLREFCARYPDWNVIFVSRSVFKPFFTDIPKLRFVSLLPDSKHRGLRGLYSLFSELNKFKPSAIADLHNNLRTKILCYYFRVLKNIPSVQLDKGRSEKKALTRIENKVLVPLRSTPERYADVFRKLGFEIHLSHQLQKNKKELPTSIKQAFEDSERRFVGISPFAKHKEKVYPLEKMQLVIEELSAKGIKTFIFGGGPEEAQTAEDWEAKYPGVTSLIGKYNLSEELQIISNLDLMLSMDSAGMHMASLMGTKAISVWGATHPFAGFLGYGQSDEDTIQIDLYCRPCSVFGNRKCYRGDHACMYGIDSGMIVESIVRKLDDGKRSFPY